MEFEIHCDSAVTINNVVDSCWNAGFPLSSMLSKSDMSHERELLVRYEQ